MEEGQLVRWLKSEGNHIQSGDILAEIETDKAVMELVARGDGLLRRILLAEGGTAEVGAVIGVIAAEDEDISALTEGTVETETTAEREDVSTEDAHDDAGGPEPQPAETDKAGQDRIKASPLARRMAGELGIGLATISGTGPKGRVIKRDVEAARDQASEAAAAPSSELVFPVAGVEGPEYEDVPVSQLRKTIARRLAESIGPVPTFYLSVTVDMSRTLEARHSMNGMLEARGIKASLNDFVLKATAVALARHPECNAHWLGRVVRQHRRVHLGVAVAVEDGLITPVVRDANLKGIVAIAGEVRELAKRARAKRLAPEEYTGSTFSVSNLGMFGIHEFTAIINPPEAGILAVGGITETPVVQDGEMVIRPMMRVTMSCDHRVIDGAQGALFLATLKRMLEEPANMLM